MSVEDIRALIDPAQYYAGLDNAQAVLSQNLASMLVDYDLIAGNPELPDETKEAAKKQLLSQMEDVVWRLEEIGRRRNLARGGAD